MDLLNLLAARPPPLSDGQRLEVGGVPVRLRVNPRARRVSLRIDARRREVVATAPSLRRLKEAAAFAGERLAWMGAQIAALPAPARLEPGGRLDILGRPCRLLRTDRRAEVGLTEDDGGYALTAQGDGDIYSMRAVRLLRAHALTVLTERTRHHAFALGQRMPQVSLTDAKSRWGSCKPTPGGGGGVIRYSWRLVMAPWFVADYVAAHECAHLVEANHGPRFWALVRDLFGSEREARAWLRTHGSRLHAVGRA